MSNTLYILCWKEFVHPVLEGMDPESGIDEDYRMLYTDKCVGLGATLALKSEDMGAVLWWQRSPDIYDVYTA
eukprot:1158946-Pelagomonas_calceolata.AAC.5